MRNTFTIILSPEYLCHSVWKELQMREFLKEQGVSAKVTPVLAALVIGRLIDPGSERYNCFEGQANGMRLKPWPGWSGH